MKDFKVVQAKLKLTVHSLSPIRGFRPPSVLVLGENLSRTSEVLYNGIEAREFLVSGENRLVVRIPESQVGKDLYDLEVFTSAPLTNTAANILLGVGSGARNVEGIERLIQSFVMVFMTTPGSDIFSPQSGGGGRALVGRTTDRSGKSVAADLAQAVDRTRTELLRVQSLDRRIPPSERLLSASLAGMQFDPETTILSARVDIRNILGDAGSVSLR